MTVWALASVGFAFYAANFSKYNSTYGSIGGIITFLLWAWIANKAILFGAKLDAQIERGRELNAGIDAEETLQLPPRDTEQRIGKPGNTPRMCASGGNYVSAG